MKSHCERTSLEKVCRLSLLYRAKHMHRAKLTCRRIHQCRLGEQIHPVPRLPRQDRRPSLILLCLRPFRICRAIQLVPPDRRRPPHHHLPRRLRLLCHLVSRPSPFLPFSFPASSPDILARRLVWLYAQTICHVRVAARSRGTAQLETEWELDLGLGEVWL